MWTVFCRPRRHDLWLASFALVFASLGASLTYLMSALDGGDIFGGGYISGRAATPSGAALLASVVLVVILQFRRTFVSRPRPVQWAFLVLLLIWSGLFWQWFLFGP